jgi:hypothetical protein
MIKPFSEISTKKRYFFVKFVFSLNLLDFFGVFLIVTSTKILILTLVIAFLTFFWKYNL